MSNITYNEIVEMIESCTNDLLDTFDWKEENLNYENLFSYFNQRLSYFSLEILSKFSQNS